MSLLTDDEAQEIFHSKRCTISKELSGILYRAMEAALLAKLASAELPEPLKCFSYLKGKCQDLYSADQLRQAFAQGAASQLSAEPIGAFEALPDPTVGEIPWLNIYDIKSRVVGTKLYTLKEPR